MFCDCEGEHTKDDVKCKKRDHENENESIEAAKSKGNIEISTSLEEQQQKGASGIKATASVETWETVERAGGVKEGTEIMRTVVTGEDVLGVEGVDEATKEKGLDKENSYAQNSNKSSSVAVHKK